MKKVLMIAALAIATPAVITSTTSCGSMSKTAGAVNAVSKIGNIAATASEISGVLGQTLGLDQAQKSSVTGVFNDYISGTNGIASLANTASYASKLSSLNTGVLGKLKGIFTAAQYAKMLELGGNKSGGIGSLLGGLTGGNSLSTGAASVLGGLLLNN